MDSPSDGSPIFDNLVRLPNELVDLIAQDLVTSDIRALRLANRKLYHLFTLYLLDSITVSSHQESLDRIDAISKDQLLRQGIKCLKFDVTTFRIGSTLDVRQ